MISLYLALLLGYLGTVLIAWESIPKRSPLTYASLILVLIGSGAAMYVTYDSNQTTDELLSKSKKISELSLKLYSSSSSLAESQRQLRIKADNQTDIQVKLREKSDEIAHLNHEIAKSQTILRIKSDEIATLNKHITNSVTGGEYQGELSVFEPDENNLLLVEFWNKGNYPLYDVTLNIHDLDRAVEVFKDFENNIDTKKRGFSFAYFQETRQKAIIKVEIGNVSPHTTIHLPTLIVPNTERQRIDFEIIARNGSARKQVRFVKVNGKWKGARRDVINGKIVGQQVDKGFSADGSGSIW